jgi:hypothetical protein
MDDESGLKTALSNEHFKKEFDNFIRDNIHKVELGNEWTDPIITIVGFCSRCGNLHEIEDNVSNIIRNTEMNDMSMAIGIHAVALATAGFLPFMAFMMLVAQGGKLHLEDLPEPYRSMTQDEIINKTMNIPLDELYELAKQSPSFKDEPHIVAAGMMVDMRRIMSEIEYEMHTDGTVSFDHEYEHIFSESTKLSDMGNRSLFEFLAAVFAGAKVAVDKPTDADKESYNETSAIRLLGELMSERLDKAHNHPDNGH